MKDIRDYKIIFWDFDGVLMDSMPVRRKGFEDVLKGYPIDQVLKLLEFHENNGGLSRYVKFRYFFETIRSEKISDEILSDFANLFSKVMLDNLLNKDLLIKDSMSFVEKYHSRVEMHIASGSDGKELNYICDTLGVSKFFTSINGSPENKADIVNRLISSNGYNKKDIVLVGDSINDLEAACANGIDFAGYNNRTLENDSRLYINSFVFEQY